MTSPDRTAIYPPRYDAGDLKKISKSNIEKKFQSPNFYKSRGPVKNDTLFGCKHTFKKKKGRPQPPTPSGVGGRAGPLKGDSPRVSTHFKMKKGRPQPQPPTPSGVGGGAGPARYPLGCATNSPGKPGEDVSV